MIKLYQIYHFQYDNSNDFAYLVLTERYSYIWNTISGPFYHQRVRPYKHELELFDIKPGRKIGISSFLGFLPLEILLTKETQELRKLGQELINEINSTTI